MKPAMQRTAKAAAKSSKKAIQKKVGKGNKALKGKLVASGKK